MNKLLKVRDLAFLVLLKRNIKDKSGLELIAYENFKHLECYGMFGKYSYNKYS